MKILTSTCLLALTTLVHGPSATGSQRFEASSARAAVLAAVESSPLAAPPGMSADFQTVLQKFSAAAHKTRAKFGSKAAESCSEGTHADDPHQRYYRRHRLFLHYGLTQPLCRKTVSP